MKLKPWYSAAPMCCLLLFVAACGKKGDESGGDSGPVDTTEYTIKTSTPRVDAPVAITDETKMELRLSVRDPQGKLLKELNNSKKENKAWTETVLAAEKDKEKTWTKLKIVFNRIETEQDGKSRPAPKLIGRTVIATRTSNMVAFQPQDKDAFGFEEQQTLQAEFGSTKKDEGGHGFMAETDFLPNKPVRPGETWNPSPKGFGKMFKDSRELSLDTEKATATGRLVRAYKKNGKQFGVIEIDAKFPFKEAPNAKPTEGSKMTIAVRYDGCIDGSICEANASATMDGTLDATAPKGSFKMNFNATFKYTEIEKP